MDPSGRRHLRLVREPSRRFPTIPNPTSYESARIWHCRYATLEPIAAFVNLRSLEVATYPDPTLEPLAGLVLLERLQIVHLPNISDLSPLRSLRALRYVSLATLPSWDSSDKVTEVLSLGPLADLPLLEELELFGVRPPGGSVDDLLRLPSLRTARVSKYPRAEAERLRQELGQREHRLR